MMPILPARVVRVARAVTEAMFDPGHGVDQARVRWFLDDLQEFMVAAGIKTRIALRAALVAVQYSPLFTMGRLRRFSSLPIEDRITALERFELSQASILFAAIKTIFAMIWFEHPRSLMEVGLEPRLVWPGVEEVMPDQLEPLSASGQAHASAAGSARRVG